LSFRKEEKKVSQKSQIALLFLVPAPLFLASSNPATFFELNFFICSLPEAGNADTDPAHLNGWQ
jgi:hypothetical protein